MNIALLILLFFVIMILLMVNKTTYSLTYLEHKIEEEDKDTKADEFQREKISDSKVFNYAGMTLVFLLIGLIVYMNVEGTVYEGHMREWMNIVVRLLHITFGIAWIGTSFYFVGLENSLDKENKREGIAGDLWSVHGGGFYFIEKYKVAPKNMPKELHWFKYEAYFTWLSGFCLLFVVYYFNANSMLIDPNVWDVEPWVGVLVGIGSLILGYAIYDLMSRTPLLKKPMLFGLVGFIIAVLFAYFYTQVFSARAAYIHFGALLGTCMAGNVFFCIIPAQKALVKAAKEGSYLDPWLGQFARMRSFHNNYFTMPVLFVMISNHFPSTFGHEWNWLILAAITLGTAGLKHYFNLREQGKMSTYVFPISLLILISVAFLSAPQAKGGKCSPVEFPVVYNIIKDRCQQCHSSKPTDKIWTSAPNGMKLNTPDEIKAQIDQIMQRVVITETMPNNNATNMLPEEREMIRCWIEQGAKID